MKKYFHCLFIVCFLSFHNSSAQSKAVKIEKPMDLSAAYGQFNGVVLVAEKGNIIFQKAYGLADQEWGSKNTIDTKFEIASITKTFTALMVMRLAEQGRIDLKAHISDYLKDYPAETGSKITITHL